MDSASGLRKPKILAQWRLTKVIVLFSSRKLDFGTLTTELLARLFREDEKIRQKIRDTFGFDYNMVLYWERQQPVGTSDIELYRSDDEYLRISLKTTTKKNILPMLRRLCRDLKENELGALAFPLKMTRGFEEDIIVAIAILNKDLCRKKNSRELLDQIMMEINQKKLRERLDELSPIDLEQAAVLEALKISLESKEIALSNKILIRESKLIAREARDSAKEAKKIAEETKRIAEESKLIAREARDSAKEAKKIAEENREAIRRLDAKFEEAITKLNTKIDLILQLLQKKKEDHSKTKS